MSLKYAFDVGGEWSQTTVKRRDKVFLDEKHRQAHAVDRSSVFIPNDPVVVQSIEDLIGMAPPDPPTDVYRHAIAVEDNSVLPIFPSETPPPIELVERTVDLHMAVEENKAPLDAESNDGNADRVLMLTRVIAIGILIIAFGGLSLAGVVFVINEFGKGA